MWSKSHISMVFPKSMCNYRRRLRTKTGEEINETLRMEDRLEMVLLGWVSMGLGILRLEFA